MRKLLSFTNSFIFAKIVYTNFKRLLIMEQQKVCKVKNLDLKKIISFRLTENQYDLINSKIKKSGLKKSELFRNLTQSVLKEQILVSILKIN